MQRIFTLLLLAMAFLPGQAQADTFVWRDPVHEYTMSFPDTWRPQTEDNPYTRLRIAGPVQEDWETCRMQVKKDGRLKIYPKRLMTEAVVETLDKTFWEQETTQWTNAKITSYYAPASLGNKGDATAVLVSFLQDNGYGKHIQMRGIMIGSIYGDDLYVASCSSRAESYAKWEELFSSILDSVELESKYHPFATGYYRNFLIDPQLVLPRTKPGTPSRKEYRYRIPGLNE